MTPVGLENHARGSSTEDTDPNCYQSTILKPQRQKASVVKWI